MSVQLWLLYLSVVLAIIVTPGPSALLCMTHGARHGHLRALATVAGGMTSAMTLMTLTLLGLGAAIAWSDTAFLVIKLLGAGYLIYLGIVTLRAPLIAAQAPETTQQPEPMPLSRLYATGYLVGIANPKDLLFFGALFPQFIDAGWPLLPQIGILAGTWLTVECAAMSAYAVFGDHLFYRLHRRGIGRAFNRLAGSAFIAAAAALAITRH